MILSAFSMIFFPKSPALMLDITFGEGWRNPHYYWVYEPAEGWVTTTYLLGRPLNISGRIWGTLAQFDGFPTGLCTGLRYYVGVRGFTGIKIFSESFESSFIGFALTVGLSSSRP